MTFALQTFVRRLCAVGGLLAAVSGCGSSAAERMARIDVPAPSLAGSVMPNPPAEPALVLLPPNYAAGARTYPVVYYLPGFTTGITEYVDGTFDGFNLGRTLDRLVESGRIEAMIVVVLNGRNVFGGSFYVNSPVTGRWEDYVVRDVIPYVESHYRVARHSGGRGVAGESMGGFGALHLAMRILGVGPGDEVLAPTFSFVATVNPILYQGARPVLVDAEPEAWGANLRGIVGQLNVGDRPKAIVASRKPLIFMAFLPKTQEKPVDRYVDVIRQDEPNRPKWNLLNSAQLRIQCRTFQRRPAKMMDKTVADNNGSVPAESNSAWVKVSQVR